MKNSEALTTAVWCITAVADCMDEIAINGDGFELHHGSLVARLPANPSWYELATAADELITRAGGGHRFIEDFVRDGKIIELRTGS
ncbi:MAG: hypothetical protein E6H52_01645 [Betaproteobacteria bacterium]|nr:MAG: hypothetical protein E6H52_01645 [Betaproteobacteria bacterium]